MVTWRTFTASICIELPRIARGTGRSAGDEMQRARPRQVSQKQRTKSMVAHVANCAMMQDEQLVEVALIELVHQTVLQHLEGDLHSISLLD